MIAAISGGLFWLVWIYGNGLRDPRYLDGWVLAGGMGLQLYFPHRHQDRPPVAEIAHALAEVSYFFRAIC